MVYTKLTLYYKQNPAFFWGVGVEVEREPISSSCVAVEPAYFPYT